MFSSDQFELLYHTGFCVLIDNFGWLRYERCQCHNFLKYTNLVGNAGLEMMPIEALLFHDRNGLKDPYCAHLFDAVQFLSFIPEYHRVISELVIGVVYARMRQVKSHIYCVPFSSITDVYDSELIKYGDLRTGWDVRVQCVFDFLDRDQDAFRQIETHLAIGHLTIGEQIDHQYYDRCILLKLWKIVSLQFGDLRFIVFNFVLTDVATDYFCHQGHKECKHMCVTAKNPIGWEMFSAYDGRLNLSPVVHDDKAPKLINWDRTSLAIQARLENEDLACIFKAHGPWNPNRIHTL
jgi:hypothetical protein